VAARSGRRPSVGSDKPDDLGRLVPEVGRCNGTAMRKAMRRVSQIYDVALAPCGLRSTQRSILVTIARAGAPTMGELAALLVLDRTGLAHNLKPLQREGLIEIVAGERDRRSRLIALTPAGRMKLAQSLPLWEEAQRRFEAAFGEKRATRLRTMLDYIASPQFARLVDDGGRATDQHTSKTVVAAKRSSKPTSPQG
jgi:DNA-binding MarR family transcriptional regulator